jgi:chromate transporter
VVNVQQWLTPKDFLELFAVCRFLPGPSSLLGAMIGYQVAGVLGALVATLALYIPSSALFYVAARSWTSNSGKSWHIALRSGLAPIAAGLIMAGVLALFQLSGGDVLTGIVIVAVGLLFTWKQKLHPVPILIAGGALFVLNHLMK